MDLSHLLTTGNPDMTLLTQYGFETTADGLVCRYGIEGTDLYAIYTYSNDNLSVSVYDSFDDEPYPLFEDASSTGKFVTGIRYSVVHFAETVLEKAKVQENSLRDKVIQLFSERYGIGYDNPWSSDPVDRQNLVFRIPSGKWVGLLMTIPISRLGLPGESLIDCINLKHRPDDIDQVIDEVTVFPAYHMNKKHWITVLITPKSDRNRIISLIEESINLVKGL